MLREPDEKDLQDEYIEEKDVDNGAWICPNCGHENNGEDSYCIWC